MINYRRLAVTLKVFNKQGELFDSCTFDMMNPFGGNDIEKCTVMGVATKKGLFLELHLGDKVLRTTTKTHSSYKKFYDDYFNQVIHAFV